MREKYKKKSLILMLIGLILVFNATRTFAEEDSGLNFDDILEGVHISGYLTSFYQFNFSETSDGPNGGGRDALGFPNNLEFRDNNSITLEASEIQIFKEATEEHPIGFGFVTAYGEFARRRIGGGRFPNGDHGNNDEDRFGLDRGYVQWLMPIGKGIDFKIGLIGTWLATEGVEDVNNPNLTHSINFQFSYPARHTGFGLSYPVTDSLTASVYLVNGWASFTDNNDAKSVGWQLSWNPNDRILMNFNGLHGAEKPGNNSDITNLFTWAGYFTINDKLSFVANFNYGWTENNKIDTDGDGFNDAGASAHWAGGVLTAIWTFTDWINLAARYEYADYTDEFNLNAWSATATLNVSITESLMIRPEYRHNGFTGSGSDIRPTFSSDPGRDSDDIFAIGFSYIF